MPETTFDMRLPSGRREEQTVLARGGLEGPKAPRGGVTAVGGRLLYRGSQADMNLWSSGERMLTSGGTPV